MNILSIGAHPDDIEIGCAGTLLKWKDKGFKHYLMVMTDGRNGGELSTRQKEQERSAGILGAEEIFWGGFQDTTLEYQGKILVDTIENALKKIQPAFVLVNYPEDTHQDHRALGLATISAARYSKNVLFYECVNSVDFHPTVFVDISSCIERKFEVLQAHASQIDKTHIEELSIVEIAKAMAHFRGTQGRVKYGEGFQALRLFVNI
jgi:LmbE family N-acetylglucosaminyl deacetylase